MANLLLHRFPSILSPASSNPFNQFTAFLPSTRPSQFQVQPLKTSDSRSVKCMATPRRVKMVAKQIMRELSDMLLTDKNLQYAVLPEAALGADRYLSSLTTISDVEVSTDLQVVKVYVSIFGDERGRDVALSGLKAKAKYVRSQLGKRMKLRLTPEVRFIEDESFERGSRVIAILDKIKNENETKSDQIQGKETSDQLSEDDNDDWEEEGDEGHYLRGLIASLSAQHTVPDFLIFHGSYLRSFRKANVLCRVSKESFKDIKNICSGGGSLSVKQI